MRHNLLSTSFTPMATTTTPHHHNNINNNNNNNNKKPSSSSSNPNHSTSTCSHHSPSATLDILILILVLFSATFLLSSYLSYLFHSLSLLLPPLSLSSLLLQHHSSLYLIGFFLFFLLSILSLEICCGNTSRKCGKKGCKGFKKAMEFDLQLQSEDLLRSATKAVKEVDDLPWKGGTEINPDYECLRTELRKMAPVNGRAVLLFRLKCGCPVAKLEGWGPKRGRRNKKNLSLNHG